MRICGINKNTVIMTKAEFTAFMANKTLYTSECSWYEKWDKRRGYGYIPSYNNFILANRYELQKYPYPGYGPKCLDCQTKAGVGFWDLPRWTARQTQTTRARKEKLYYVTKRPGGKAAL